MPARHDRSPQHVPRAFFSHGPLDVAPQVVVFVVDHRLYRLARGLADDPDAATAALQDARDLIGIQRTPNVFVEPFPQAVVVGEQRLLDGCAGTYVDAQASPRAAVASMTAAR